MQASQPTGEGQFQCATPLRWNWSRAFQTTSPEHVPNCGVSALHSRGQTMGRALPLAPTTGLHERVTDYASSVYDQRTPSDVLNALHDITKKSLPLAVLGAARFPPKAAGWDSAQLGDSIFLHKGVPKGWWEEYELLARGKFRPLLFLAQSSMAPFTWAEAKQVLEPVGDDRWSDELFQQIWDARCILLSRWWAVGTRILVTQKSS